MRDDLRNYVLEMLGSEDAVLIVDKTGFVKKWEHSVGVKRQHSGTAGRIENCQVGVFLAYASEKGTAFIDRELFLPEEWAHEQKQRKGADVPAERKFLSKPQLAQRMLKRAFTAGVKATWVMADTVCSSWRLRTFLEEHQQPYVLAVPSNFMVRFIDKGGVQQPHIKTLFKKLEPEARQHFPVLLRLVGQQLYHHVHDKARGREDDMIAHMPALPSPAKVVRDAARAVKRVASLSMKKLSAETLNELLGLPGLVVTEYALEKQGETEVVHIFCEHRHELAICPGCGEVSSALHDKSMRSVRHLDIWGKMTLLHFPSRRFYCQGCDKPFTETLAWLEEGRRHTQRFELHIYEQCQRSPAEAVARAEQLHPATVRAIFQRWAKRQEKEHRRPLLRRLGVDEIALKKGHKNYVLVLSDLARHCVVAVLSNRRQASLSEWLLGLSEDERAAIEVVAMDMWAPYRSVVKRLLPEAEIVADRFHVMKQLNEQLSKLRREVQKGADAKVRKRLKEARWLLLRRCCELTPEQKGFTSD